MSEKTTTHHEIFESSLAWQESNPEYGIIILLHSFFVPVKRHAPYPSTVIEPFWSDETHMVVFHRFVDAVDYIAAAQEGKQEGFLPTTVWGIDGDYYKGEKKPDDTKDSQ